MPLPNPAQALRDALLAQIMSGDWPPGQRLPTERALSLEYGIGRSVVRRVLAELKRERLITQTVGSGTYVAAVAPSPAPHFCATGRFIRAGCDSLFIATTAIATGATPNTTAITTSTTATTSNTVPFAGQIFRGDPGGYQEQSS